MVNYTSRARTLAPARRTVVPREWEIGNFKSLEHVTLPLRKLVVLTGANSSGKSSVIQSLLLLAQSTDDEIILNGPLVRLGEPTDVIRSGCNILTLAYSVTTRQRVEEDSREWSFELSLTENSSSLRVHEFHAAVDGEHLLTASAKRVAAATEGEVNPEGRYGDAILHVRELSGRKAPPRTFLSFRGFYPEALLLRPREQQIRASLRRNYSLKAIREDSTRAFQLYDELQPWWRANEKDFPTKLVEQFGHFFRQDLSPARMAFELEREDLDELFKLFASSIGADEWYPLPISRYLSGFRPTAGRAQFTFLNDHEDNVRGLAVADDALRSMRESVRYLGPLREEPQVVSATGGRNRSVPAGPKGEYTADLLARGKNEVVEFFDWDRQRHRLKLPEAVSLWTTYLGVGETVAVEDQGKLGRGLRLKVDGVERDLTTVGVGASQVLPVLTVVLAANRGSVVCLEQPEIHLHPAVQTRLADFFLWSRPDLTLVVETHSEYLVSRLRRRIAEKAADYGDVTIMFAEQTSGVTDLRRLRLSALGELSDWPAGFFDTQDEEDRALVRAVAHEVGEGRQQ